MELPENVEKALNEVAIIAAEHFTKTLSKDIIQISAGEKPNMQAISLAISHFALAYALLEILKNQNPDLSIPGDYARKMGEALGIDEASRLKRELDLLKGLQFADMVVTPDTEVKESWKSQL